MSGFNLPPGCSNLDIERAAGSLDDQDNNVCPECGTDFTQPHLGPELKLLVEIADWLQMEAAGKCEHCEEEINFEHGTWFHSATGAQGCESVATPARAHKFIGPLESLINRIKAEERVR